MDIVVTFPLVAKPSFVSEFISTNTFRLQHTTERRAEYSARLHLRAFSTGLVASVLWSSKFQSSLLVAAEREKERKKRSAFQPKKKLSIAPVRKSCFLFNTAVLYPRILILPIFATSSTNEILTNPANECYTRFRARILNQTPLSVCPPPSLQKEKSDMYVTKLQPRRKRKESLNLCQRYMY